MSDKYINASGLGELKSWILTKLGLKQDVLVPGTNLKTVNGQSLLGSGNVDTMVSMYDDIDLNFRAHVQGVDFTNGEGNESSVISFHRYTDEDILTVDLDVWNDEDGTLFANRIICPSRDSVNNALSTKADLVPNAVNGEVLITDAQGQPQSSGTDLATLLNDVEAGKEAFLLKDFNQQINITIPSVTSDVANTSIPNMDIDLDVIDPTGDLNSKYAIAGLIKYEIYDATSGGNRLNAFPICSFSMNSQRTLRVRCMVGGTTSKTARRIQGALLLKHR